VFRQAGKKVTGSLLQFMCAGDDVDDQDGEFIEMNTQHAKQNGHEENHHANDVK
jgi:hypothetical protein